MSSLPCMRSSSSKLGKLNIHGCKKGADGHIGLGGLLWDSNG